MHISNFINSFTVTLVMMVALLDLAFLTHAQQPADQIVNNPDAFAWKVFIELNHPASISQGRGVPDNTKKIGDDGPVVWQTWMRTEEVFLEKGKRPTAWGIEPTIAPFGVAPVIRRQFHSPRKILLLDDPRAAVRFLGVGEPPPQELGESSMNRPAFEFIVNNELYNIEGQEAFHAAGRIVNLPPEAREIKSAWKLLSSLSVDMVSPAELEAFKKRYHTTTLAHDGKTFIYGLTALHITTKDLPNWVWATFEHIDNPGPELPDNDRSGQPKILVGTKWANYRLRGTLIDFVDSAGQPTILANTQIEAGFQQTSSCITCHARATIGDQLPRQPGTTRIANRLPFFEIFRVLHRRASGDLADQVIRYGNIGVPQADWFNDNRNRRRYTQLDFMWSLRNAQSKQQP